METELKVSPRLVYPPVVVAVRELLANECFIVGGVSLRGTSATSASLAGSFKERWEMGSGLGEGSGVAALEVKGTLSHPPTLQYFI